MSREKVFISILMVSLLIVLSGASVWAAPPRQEEPPISGEVQEIVPEVDETGTITVLVTLVDELGETQTVRVSLETAANLGLVQVDENDEPVLDDTGKPIVNQDAIGSTVEIDPSLVIDEEEEGEEPLAEHPVASALAAFFADALGLDYDTIMDHHESGIGFGVIAQACWMSYALEGDVTLLDTILNAKKSGDFSAIMLSEDGETASNWGQFKKAVLKSGNEKVQKNLANLGAIMSGRAEPPGGTDGGDEDELGATSTEGKVKGKKDQAGGKPDAPPGQVKNKDKGKGGGKNK